MVEYLVKAFATDYNDRSFDNGKATPYDCFVGRNIQVPLELLANPNEVPHPRMRPIAVYEDDRVRVSAVLVQHAPVFPAFAYRFDTEHGAVIFSGDTSPSENLIELATGAKVLVHEVISSDWVSQVIPPPRDDAAEATRQHLLTSHTTVEQVGGVAERAGVETLVLSHFAPPSWPDDYWRRAQSDFSGQLLVGHDLLEIPLLQGGGST